MGKIIAVTNQKGGVGKTTTCVNLCCALRELGARVLLCDTDPQGNATSGMGIDKTTITPNLYNVLVGDVPAEKAVVSTKYGDVIPSNAVLSGAGIELVNAENREFILKNALESMKDKYDYIFIDCPPSLEMLTLNALCAADSVFIPVQCEYFALEGLTDLIGTIRMTKKALNPKLDIEGVLLTMFDARTNFSAQVAEEVKKFFRGKVYNVMIPRNVRISEAPSHGVPVIVYDKSSRGAVAYTELAKEFMRRNK
ncbi:MAG TPA: ParA family protein [Papillibacter sp.]|jgi:chromosome partitioning protein|nr:ParA family protein [Papillibacter sp.]